MSLLGVALSLPVPFFFGVPLTLLALPLLWRIRSIASSRVSVPVPNSKLAGLEMSARGMVVVVVMVRILRFMFDAGVASASCSTTCEGVGGSIPTSVDSGMELACEPVNCGRGVVRDGGSVEATAASTA